MIEIGLGQYPYPPETYSNVFAQLTAIVNGDPPELPEEKYSEIARDWVSLCLKKDPDRRASYTQLLVSFVSVFPHLSVGFKDTDGSSSDNLFFII